MSEGLGWTEDTIAAIATPPGEGGIGIVRMSGRDAVAILKEVFRPFKKDVKLEEVTHRLVYGHVYGNGGEPLDEVLVGIMRAPHSYTREDVVEINCHGGLWALRLTLEAVLRKGARPAEPGEFTKRAFLNGRLDLAQAEAVADIIRARSEEAHRLALGQLEGRVSARVASLADKVLSLLAAVEAELDFPMDDVGEHGGENFRIRVSEITAGLEELLRGFAAGRVYREGVSIVLAGKPNVGKSSLLNALIGRDRAIVTPVPGTTRDVIEERVVVRGIAMRLADTAGLHGGGDGLEILGMERTRRALNEAQLVIMVGDTATGVTGEDRDLARDLAGRPVILVVNKADLGPAPQAFRDLAASLLDCRMVEVSALTGAGLTELETVMVETVLARSQGETPLVAAVRHARALERAREALLAALERAGDGWPLEVLASELHSAWEALGEITGAVGGPELIDRIFRDFCVGK